MLIGTTLATSGVPVQSTPAINSNEIVSDVALVSESNIDAPAKALDAAKKAASNRTALAATVSTAPKAVAGTKVSASLITNVPGSSHLDAWINGLIQKESSGQTNIKILDTNNRYSYGCLQFQMPTFIAYGKRYGFISGTEANLESLIMSCSLQKAIAKKMILDDSDNWRHWYHSVYTRGLGLPPIN